MANRNFASGGKIYSMHVMPVMLDVKAVIGAAGAVSSIAGSAIKSVVHISTGIYQINLADNYNSLFQAIGQMHSPVSGLSGVSSIEIQNAPSASVSVLASPSLTVKCLSPAGALIDPVSGSTLAVLMYLSNSSIKVNGE